MPTHQKIDARSLMLHQAIAAKIDADATRAGLKLARENCRRWQAQSPSRATAEWEAILKSDWRQVREILLQESEEGQRLRQSSPFTGILSPQERRTIFEEAAAREAH